MKSAIHMKTIALLCCMVCSALQAQEPRAVLEEKFPELAHYLSSVAVLQAAVYEEVIATNESAEAATGKGLLVELVEDLQNAEESHYHSSGGHLEMLGPYRVFETRAIPGLVAMIRRSPESNLPTAHPNGSAGIPTRAWEVLARGRHLVSEILTIHASNDITDMDAAVARLLAEYLNDDELSVATRPKTSDLIARHRYAYAFRAGFPQLTGLTWASQWLQLAALEVMLAKESSDVAADLDYVVDLFAAKIAAAHGSILQLPTDIPTAPVIAPNLYNRYPDVAHVMDNLAALSVVIGDILAYPEVTDQDIVIERALADFTSKTEHLDDDLTYLEYVLRGGIFNQGGPATGGMDGSERNRSREATGASHSGSTPMFQ